MKKSPKAVFMTEEQISEALHQMEENLGLNTKLTDPDGMPETVDSLSFYDKHFLYLKGHPHVNPEFYLANLRTMIKIRQKK